MTDDERERIIAEIAADPDQLAEFMAGGTPLALRRWMFDFAVSRADAKVPNAADRDESVERLRVAIFHPASSDHLDVALDLFLNNTAKDTIRKALNALAGTGGNRTAN